MQADQLSAIRALIAGLLVLIFGTPLRVFWTNAAAPWWLVFVPCACAVTALFVVDKMRGARDDEFEESDQ